jgi:fatty-acyl-CoA synthase
VESPSFVPLTPTSFLARSAYVHGDRTAVVDGPLRFTYSELWTRARRLAGGLRSLGVQPGERVAVLSPNSHMLLESHFGVPLAGGVLVAMNVRLHPHELADIVGHSGSNVLLYDSSLAERALELAKLSGGTLQLVESSGAGDDGYESLLDSATELAWVVDDERSLLSINYTSGTTGRPKGVMYHHRGAYLQALAMAFHTGLGPGSKFLWTLPMFHCNGWCFPWAVTAAAGTHVCLRVLDPAVAWGHIERDGITHLNAAPTVLTMLSDHPAAKRAPNRLTIATGGSAPSPTLLGRMSDLNADVIHLYGLTETFGPTVLCEWRPEWDELPAEDQHRRKAMQGVGNVTSERLRVLDPAGRDVPADGATLGEVALRGNNVMTGYFGDPEATAAAFSDGWFRTGDIGVLHPDGYLELRDRAKDLIVSGGENISTIQVEQAIASHPAVSEVAVIGVPDDLWGERPAAYVTLREGAVAEPNDIIEHVRQRLAAFKAPTRVEFGPLPKTSTGKIQKTVLREAAWAGHERRIN